MNFNSPQIFSADRPLHDAASAYPPKRHHHHHSLGNNAADQLTPNVAARIFPTAYSPLISLNAAAAAAAAAASSASTEPNRSHSFHHSVAASHSRLPLLGGSSGPPGSTSLSHLSHHPLYIVPQSSHNGAPQPFRDTMNDRFPQDFPVGYDRLKILENPDQLQHLQPYFNRLGDRLPLTSSTSVTTSNSTLQTNNNSSNSSRRRPSLLPYNPPQSADSFSLAPNNANISAVSSNQPVFYNRFEKEKFDLYRYSQQYDSATRKSTNSNLPSVSASGGAVYPSSSASLLTQPSLHMSHHQSAGSFHPHPHQQPPPQPTQQSSSTSLHTPHNHGHLLNEIYDISNKRPRLNLSNHHHHSPYHQQGVSGAAAAAAAASGHGDSSRTTPLNQELLIDTRDNSEDQYNPHFEAISPTPNEESRNEESAAQLAKDTLLNNINSIDREITNVEILITNLSKKAKELEVVTSKPSAESEDDTAKSEQTVPSFSDKIYIETRGRAKKIHQMYPLLETPDSIPLYIEMEDVLCSHRNFAKHSSIKAKITERIRKEKNASKLKLERAAATYDKLMVKWLKHVESIDENPAKKQRDQKLREYFEKQFPELRKQREDRERLQRGTRVRSDSDTDEITDSVQVQENELKKLHGFAVIPPAMLIDQKQKIYRFTNNNGLIKDPMALHKNMKMINIWTECEKEIFREKYLQNPKKFGIVASYLERKSVGDCVQYYYLSKKIENYKQLLRKHVKKRTRALVRNQQQNQVNSAQNRGSPLIRELTANLKPYPNSATSVILPYSVPLTSTTTTIVFTVSASTTANSDTTTTTASNSESAGAASASKSFTLIGSSSNNAASVSLDRVNITSTFTTAACDISDTNNSSSTSEQCDKLKCVVCDLNIECVTKARPVTQANMTQYGLSHLNESSLCYVCLYCDQRITDRRPCPIPSCKTPRRKVKHLRPLPNKWIKMSAELKQQYASELNIPVNSLFACARCATRVARQLGLLNVGGGSNNSCGNDNNASGATSHDATDTISKHDKKNVEALRKSWTESDLERFRQLLREHGNDWTAIANALGGERTYKDCRRTYLSFKHEFNLWPPMKEYNESTGKNANLSESDDLSDDTGDETSSAEDERANSDTASASSSVMGKPEPEGERQPIVGGGLQELKPLSASHGSLKSDYDSSATMSADEGASAVDHSAASAVVSTTVSLVDSSSRNTCITTSALYSSSKTPTTYSEVKVKPHHPIFPKQHESPTQIVPTFLINPNAPSIQVNSSHTSSLPPQHPAVPPGGREEPTCVRDLIYKAIEMSLQPDSKPTSSSSTVATNCEPYAALISESNPAVSAATAAQAAAAAYPLCLKRESLSEVSKMDMLASTAMANAAAAASGKQPPYKHLNASTAAALANSRPEGLAMMNFPYLNQQMPNATSFEPDLFEVQDLSSKSKERRNMESAQHRNSPLNKAPTDHKQSSRASPSILNNGGKPYGGQYNIQPAHSNQQPPRVSLIDSFLQQDKNSGANSGRSSHSASPFPAPTPPMGKLGNKSTSFQMQTSERKTPNAYVQLSPKSTTPSSSQPSGIAFRDKLLPQTMAGSITHGTPVVIHQQLPPPPLPPPQSQLLTRFANSPYAGYDAMLRHMNVAGMCVNPSFGAAVSAANNATSSGGKETHGSITQGTPLIVGQNPPPISSAPLPVLFPTSAASSSNRLDNAIDFTTASVKSRFSEPNSMLNRVPTNMYDAMVIENLAKRGNLPNSIPPPPSSFHMPFSANMPPTAYLNNKFGPQQLAAVAATAGGKEPGGHLSNNQILIDFNTSKQMQPRRSSASSEKEPSDSANPPPSGGSRSTNPTGDKSSRLSNSSYRVSPAPSPNNPAAPPPALFLNDRGQLVRSDDKHPIDPAALSWAFPGLLSNRQNVIQQWNTGSAGGGGGTPLLNQASKASVIQTPKSNSPRDVASGMFPPDSDAFTTLVNAAVQQPSLSVPPATTASGSLRIKDSKSLSMEGFEKCLMESMQKPKMSYMSESEVTDLSNRDKGRDSRRNVSKSGERPSSVENSEMKHFLSPHDQFMKNKKIEQQSSDNSRFRSVEALANSSASAALNPGLRFVREPFSSEHFERELKSKQESKSEDKSKVKSSADMQDEASKLFSQSFKKDSQHSQNSMLSAASLINQIIIKQINADSDKNSLNDHRQRQRLEKQQNQSPRATPPTSAALVPIKTEISDQFESPSSLSLKSENKEYNTPKLHISTSLRDTINNVITNNFINSSLKSPTSPGGNEFSSSSSGSKQGRIASRIPESMIQSTAAANENFKLRKALQSASGEKHSAEVADSAPPSSKRLATESSVQRQQVIHLANATTTTTTGSNKPPLPPHYIDSLSQGTAAVSRSGIPPATSASLMLSHHPASKMMGQPSTWPHIWPILPPPYYNHNQKLPPNQSGPSEESSPAPSSAHLSQLNLTGHLHHDYFQSRIAEAMQQPNSNNTNNNASTNDADGEKTKSEASRSETPKKESSNEQAAASQQPEPDKVSYPDSPSSPGEMVIDENPTSSPDVKSSDHSSSPSSENTQEKKPETETFSEHSSSGGVIKMHNNTSSDTQNATSTNSNRKPAISSPQYEPLSDDES